MVVVHMRIVDLGTPHPDIVHVQHQQVPTDFTYALHTTLFNMCVCAIRRFRG